MSSSSVTLRMLPPAGLLARLKRAGTDTGSLRLIERHARAYRRAFPDASIHYAAKAFLCSALVRWIREGEPPPRSSGKDPLR